MRKSNFDRDGRAPEGEATGIEGGGMVLIGLRVDDDDDDDVTFEDFTRVESGFFIDDSRSVLDAFSSSDETIKSSSDDARENEEES